ncbi:uncharacterized protein Bfra_007047 [Botrytis fragariae]|uniref:Uncharacterized protein n=1 Tax=Botrytis fragariae TaxID=1964551 RepID=A0A8H6AI85_9HELO|nr:uncharacterized protein Bfra_007047 [Botrytis fragariae]KAF5867852.1 hypothetical protein Bfra_007047 [Botrytis fragariae]
MAQDEDFSSRELLLIDSFQNCWRPTRYASKDSGQLTCPATNSVNFDAKKQSIEIIVHGLWRWLVIVSFVDLLNGSISHFKSQEVSSPIQVLKPDIQSEDQRS